MSSREKRQSQDIQAGIHVVPHPDISQPELQLLVQLKVDDEASNDVWHQLAFLSNQADNPLQKYCEGSADRIK